MKKFMLKIEDNMCKNDEIAILDKLEQEYFQCPDNYLYDFFCGQNVQWLRNKIQDDIFPALPYKMEARIVNQDIEIKNLREQLESKSSKLIEIDKELDLERLDHHHTKNKLTQMEEMKEEARMGRIKANIRIINLENRLKVATEQMRTVAEYTGAI